MPHSGEPPPNADDWIMNRCDTWMSCTYNSFYQKVETEALSDGQWKVFCADMADAFLTAARLDTSLSALAFDNATWFRSQTASSGSACGRRLVSSLNSVSPGLPSIAAAWTLMTVVWRAWCHVGSRSGAKGKYGPVVAQITKLGMENAITDARKALNEGLKTALITERDAAKAAFDSTLRGISACLDNALEDGSDAAAVVCSCGRPGHLQEQCTFKSRLI